MGALLIAQYHFTLYILHYLNGGEELVVDWMQIFDGVGVPIAMLIYFIWHSQKRDQEFREERDKHAAAIKQAREEHIAAEKESLLKYAELTCHVTEVISRVQKEINALTEKVSELAETIRTQIRK